MLRAQKDMKLTILLLFLSLQCFMTVFQPECLLMYRAMARHN